MKRISSLAVIAVCACSSKSSSTPAAGAAATPVTIDAAAAAAARRIDLPTVPEASARTLHASAYLVITRDGARADGLVKISAGADAIDVATLDGELHPAPAAPPAMPDAALALDDGKMGAPDRAAGQYKMTRSSGDAVAARQQAIEAARNAGILGTLAPDQRGAFGSLTPTADRDDSAAPQAIGTVLADGVAPPDDALLIAADRDAPARAVSGVLFNRVAVLGVSTDGGAHAKALRVLFEGDAVGANGAPLAPPMLVITVSPHVRRDVLESIYRQAAELHRDDATRDVSLIVGADATVAQLVLAIDTLAGAGATRIVVADVDRRPPARPAGYHIGGDRDAGGYDKQVIRTRIQTALPAARACYERRVREVPALAGTVTVKFEIGTDGHVTGAVGDGVDAQVARCVADVVKGLRFPSPPSGTVRVSYPFVFRATP